VNVVAVAGNFDDAQTGVKALFSDRGLASGLDARGFLLSSANSINWGRLVPQIAYYVSAYCDLLAEKAIAPGEKINFCVPTGNFGNILAGYYAERMGLPVGRLVCASNSNDVLAQFIGTGVYDRNRPFHATVSPSMDILVSSNLERLLFELSGKDGGVVAGYMAALSDEGRYAVSDAVRGELGRAFAGGRCSEEETLREIADVFDGHGYLLDTHTAVAHKVLRDYRAQSGDGALSVVVSTASAFKFCGSVLDALRGSGIRGQDSDGMDLVAEMEVLTGLWAPAPIAALRGKTARFTSEVGTDGMKSAVLDFLEG
jgi:threonine synthase